MPKVTLFNMEGSNVGELELSERVFGIEPNESVVHEAVVQYQAGLRRGTHSTKKRGEVRGGGRKPWRQKGTGRARVGSSRSPIWRSGGITFGPKPRDYSYQLPKKKSNLAMRSVLSDKVLENNMCIVDVLNFEAPKTKDMLKVLSALKLDGKVLLVLPEADMTVMKSARNIEGVTPITVSELNVYDMLRHGALLVTKEAVAKIEEVLA